MNQKRILIEKLFDDNSIIKWDTKLYINNDEDRVRFWYPYWWKKLLWELLDIAVFCARWWEDFDEYTFSVWEYEERTTITFKWWVWANNPYFMNVDYISERFVSYDENHGINNTEIFSWFYYIETLDLVKNILELLDRSYKAFEECRKEINWKKWKEYVIKNRDDIKKDLACEIYWLEDAGKETEVEMNDENLEKAKNLMMFEKWYFDDKTVEEIAEKKCYIIKQLWFWYENDKRYKDFPKYVNNLEPIVDLHANDSWKYPHIWTNFSFIWDWRVNIEI